MKKNQLITFLKCKKCNTILDFLTEDTFKNKSKIVYNCTCGSKTTFKKSNYTKK